MKDWFTRVRRSKTMIFSILLTIFGVLETQYALLRSLVPLEYQGLVLVAIGVIVAVLRLLTTKPLSEK